jgi:hypothetical protein
MKFIILSLTLFVITTPVLAKQSSNPGKCLEKYRSYFHDFEISQSQPKALLLYFADMCLPEAPRSEDPQYFKLLQRIDDDDQVITVQASLSRRGLMELLH